MNETQKENVFSRYHHSIFLPDSSSELLLEFFDSFDKVNITKHALAESYKDKKAYIIIPNKSQLLSNQSYLIEIYIPKENGVELGYIQKAVIRVKNLSPYHDFSYVISREGYIISLWANDKNDIHRIKNKKKYCREQNDSINFINR